MDKVEIVFPWNSKWKNHFANLEINWHLVWKNVHNNMLQYKVQSSLLEFMNLNFISSFNLNRMYNTSNLCLQCKMPEENIFHIQIYCPVSIRIYDKFLPLLNAIYEIELTEKEIAFGLDITDWSNQRKETLRNYIFSIIKYTIFKNRCSVQISNEQKIESIFNKSKKFIIKDLKLGFELAKKNKNITKFEENFLIENVLAQYQEDTGVLVFNI